MKINFGLSLIFLFACSHPAPQSSFSSPPHPPFQNLNRSQFEVLDDQFAVASQGEATSRAAQDIFARGGNIIDAAIAASFTISVERPQSTGIGGGGFMMIYLAKTKEVLAFDFREMAPLQATEKMYQDTTGNVVPDLSTQGILASATPGLVKGLITIHKKYGKLPLAQVMQPAIDLAQKGFKVYPHLAKAIETYQKTLSTYPGSKKLFLSDKGDPLNVGDMLVQKELAQTLRIIAQKGADGFYKGKVAKALLQTHQKYKGLLTQKDLDAYTVKQRTPIHVKYQGLNVFSMPPPSSGGIHVAQILGVLENDDLKKLGAYAPKTVHLTAASMKRAFKDRAKYLGDPDFTLIPVEKLLNPKYLLNLRKTIFEKDTPSKDLAQLPFNESKETTHFSMIDQAGNMVASSQTINGWLGAGIVVEGAGFVLNNEMDDFSSKPGVPNKFGVTGGKENAIAPLKRPLSSMSPTLVLNDAQPVLALGSPSGSQIITCVALTLLNYLEHQYPLYESVTALRYHHQWLPDELLVEKPGFDSKTLTRLKQMGYTFSDKDIGCKIQAVAKEKNQLHAVSDPRGEGSALGLHSVAPQPNNQSGYKVTRD